MTVGAAPKAVARPKKMEVKDWSPEEEDELIFVEEEGNQIPVHPLGAKPKAAAQAGKRRMSMGGEYECGGQPGARESASPPDRSTTRPAGQGHQEHQAVRDSATNSKVDQVGCGHKDSMLEGSSNKSQVSSMTHEVICHLEKISTKLEQEVAKLVSHTSDAVRTRQTLRAEKRLQVGSLGNLL